MSFIIRKFRVADAPKVSNIIKLGFHSLVPEWYSKESVEGQIKQNTPGKLIDRAKKVNYFVAAKGDQVLGIGGYDNEKLHTFFVRPTAQRQGIGQKIIEKVLDEARKEGIYSLKCWSTLSAVRFYSRFGFREVKRLEVESRNSSITFVEMVKDLT